jgi:anti-anti-sigma factor
MSQPQYRHFTTETIDGVLVLTITEPQVHGDALTDRLRQDFLAAVHDTAAKRVIIDFQNVAYISSAVFRPLLSLRRELQEAGGGMVLCNLAPQVLEVFQALRLATTSRSYPATFDVQLDVSAAVASLREEGAEKG